MNSVYVNKWSAQHLNIWTLIYLLSVIRFSCFRIFRGILNVRKNPVLPKQPPSKNPNSKPQCHLFNYPSIFYSIIQKFPIPYTYSSTYISIIDANFPLPSSEKKIKNKGGKLASFRGFLKGAYARVQNTWILVKNQKFSKFQNGLKVRVFVQK